MTDKFTEGLSTVLSLTNELLVGDREQECFDRFLACLLEVSGSEWGVFGEFMEEVEGGSCLKIRAVSNFNKWEKPQRLYLDEPKKSVEFSSFDDLLEQLIVRGETVVVSGDSSSDANTSEEKYPINNFWAEPLLLDGKLVGMLGLLNRPRGYGQDMRSEFRPFLEAATLALCVADKANRKNDFISYDGLAETPGSVDMKKGYLPRVLDNIGNPIIAYDRKGNVTLMNRSAQELLDHCSKKTGSKAADWMVYVSLYDSSTLKPLPLDDMPVIEVLKGKKSAFRELLLRPAWTTAADNADMYYICTAHEILDDSGRRIGALASMQDVTQLTKASFTIDRQANYDVLTGLANRRLMAERLDARIASCEREHIKGALIYIDLDNFKTINDSMGHSYGDEVLVNIAKNLQTEVRKEDTLARLGGDEFVVISGNIGSDTEQALLKISDFADRLLAAVASSFSIRGHEINLTASLGIVIFPNQGRNSEDLLKFADTAMYHSKDIGKNAITFFDPEMATKMESYFSLQSKLKRALDREEFFLYMQPQVAMPTGKIVGAEALIRWENPQEGLVPPGLFIENLEMSGFIIQVGSWVVEEACRLTSHWLQIGLIDDGFHLSINVSPRQFYEDNFVAHISSTLKKYQLEPAMIQLELTESVAIENMNLVTEKLLELRSLGFEISLDDFGTGYSSLSYLSQLPLNYLKIDQSFVRTLPDDTSNLPIVRAILNVCSEFGIDAITEGVESWEQMAVIYHSGCRVFQGYYFSHPLPQGAFELMLKNGLPNLPADASRLLAAGPLDYSRGGPAATH